MRYKFEKIPDGPIHRAQRYAILPSLVDDQAMKDVLFDTKALKEVLPVLRSKWITRLQLLRKAGWADVAGPGYQFLSECPPAFAYSTEQKRQCKRYNVCPYCWCRKVVVPLFRRAEAVLYPNRGEIAELDVFELQEYEYISCDEYNADAAVAEALSRLRRYRQHFAEAVGSFHLTTVDPLVSETEAITDWRLRHRVFAIIDPATEPSLLPESGADDPFLQTKRHLFGVDKQELAGAVGRVCEYPEGMFLGVAGQVIELLRARGGGRGTTPRLSVYYGALRHARSKQDGQRKKKGDNGTTGGNARRTGCGTRTKRQDD